MEVPRHFDYLRKARMAREELQDITRTYVLQNRNLHDLLIRSHHENVTNILPYLSHLNLLHSDLVIFKQFYQNSYLESE